MARIAFAKMHGLGNDFVVVERVDGAPRLTPEQVRRLADRRLGIGCDQLLTLERNAAGEDLAMGIYNADGSRAEQCGNGIRALALYAAERGLVGGSSFAIVSSGRRIGVRVEPDGRVSCDMGRPVLEPAEIPFAAPARADRYPVSVNGESHEFGVVSMGNPHAVLVVPDVEAAPVESVGSALQDHPRFPARVNVGFMQLVGRDEIRLRVFERGVGETRACGTGACAAVVVGRTNGWLGDDVTVRLTGGPLHVFWGSGDTAVWMTGEAAWVYEGTIDV